MNIEKYLYRINFEGLVSPTFSVIKELQRKHLLNVPFENLDIHNEIKIELNLNKIYSKIVEAKRGGFCYELNGLFYELLKSIGFEAIIVSAKVYDEEKGFGEEFDHLVIVVKLDDEKYLVDVGFGEFTFSPLLIQESLVQSDERGKYKIELYDINYYLVSSLVDESWIPIYLFSLVPRKISDFKNMCFYHQSSPESHFTQKRICTLPTNSGRKTLSGNILKIKENGKTIENKIETEEEISNILLNYFSIKI
ncbi:MAG: arylamine N-acetyltransferase [Ignavibacteriae bacterium]|nr:arylamine N-acetyltransferase [Ignavibacteriota bacterium]